MSEQMSDFYVSWSDYHRTIEQLALMVHRSNWKFNQIVCLAKGGLRIGDIICRISGQPLAILSTASYGGEGNRTRGSITFSKDLSMTTANLGSHILLVDDLVDSGQSLKRSISWLEHRYGFYIDEIRTAVLWEKASSVIQPDYAVHYLKDDPWIHQPFENYEEMSWEDLSRRHDSEQATEQATEQAASEQAASEQATEQATEQAAPEQIVNNASTTASIL